MLGFCVWLWFCYAILSVLSSFIIILLRKRELVALLKSSSCCHVTASVLWLFLTESWVCSAVCDCGKTNKNARIINFDLIFVQILNQP